MDTHKVINGVPMTVVVFRGKEYSVEALKAMANQGTLLKVQATLITDLPEDNGSFDVLESPIVVQSGEHYVYLFGKLRVEPETKALCNYQTVRLFSTYNLKKALLVNILAKQQPDEPVPTRPVAYMGRNPQKRSY